VLTRSIALKAIQEGPNPLSPRAYTIASYALCGFANLGSLGIQIGVLSALAPSRGRVIARIALSAMVCGFVSFLHPHSVTSWALIAVFLQMSTMQAAGIAGTLV